MATRQVDISRLAALLRTPRPDPESPDYDITGYVAKYGKPDQSNGQHLTDEFKLPNHITFSEQSRYSKPELPGGMWQRGGSEALWNFSPSDLNLEMHSPEEYAQYFKTRERKGTFVTLPDGRVIEGSQ
jgi:hypothetical protein